MDDGGGAYRGMDTTRLLELGGGGDRRAFDALFERHAGWIRARVRRRLGHALRSKLDSSDVVQEAMLRFFKHGPRLRVSNQQHFRGLMARIVENVIRDENDWFRARRRDIAREQELPEDTVIVLDARRAGERTPSTQLSQRERLALVRLALELLRPVEREVYLLRVRDRLDFAAIGERFGIRAEAADTRFRRAARRLMEAVDHLRERRIDALLESFGDDGTLEDHDGSSSSTGAAT